MRLSKEMALSMGAGFLGAVLAAVSLFPKTTARAMENTLTLAQGAEFVDGSGVAYARMEKGEGQSARLAFLNRQGQVLMDMGLDKSGLPEIRLISKRGSPHPKFVLRLVGANEAAQLVFRDNNNKDRLIMGLHPEKASEDPFLIYYDKGGVKKSVFGDYQ